MAKSRFYKMSIWLMLICGVIYFSCVVMETMTLAGEGMASSDEFTYVQKVGIVLEKLYLKPPKMVSNKNDSYRWQPGKTMFLSENEDKMTPMEFFRKYKGRSIALCLNEENIVVIVHPVDM